MGEAASVRLPTQPARRTAWDLEAERVLAHAALWSDDSDELPARPRRRRSPIHHADKEAATEDETTAAGSEAAFDAFLPAANALESGAAPIVPMRADLQLALHNVKVGVASVTAEEARARKLPGVDFAAIASLPDLALATIFADTQVTRALPPTELPKLLARGRELRALLLATAQALAVAGHLPRAKVTAIAHGRGPLDAARDCVDLAALFGKHAAEIKGKHAVPAATVKEAAEVGTALLSSMNAPRAKRATKRAEGADARDRLWTLLLRRYDELWRVGAFLFGREAIDAKVPPLQASRSARSKGAKKQAAPAPAAAAGG